MQELDLEGTGRNFKTFRDFPLKRRTVSQTHIYTFLLFISFNGQGVFTWLTKNMQKRMYTG